MKKKTTSIILIYIFYCSVISILGTIFVKKITPSKHISELHFTINSADRNIDFVRENFPVTTYDSPTKFIVNLDKIIRYDLTIDGKRNICQDMQKKYKLMPIQFKVENEIIFSDVRSTSMDLAVRCTELIKNKIEGYNSYVKKRFMENYLLNKLSKNNGLKKPQETLKELEPRIAILLDNLKVKILDNSRYDDLEINKRIEVLTNYINTKAILNNIYYPSQGEPPGSHERNLEILDKVTLIKLKHQNLTVQKPMEDYKIFIAIFSFFIIIIYIIRGVYLKELTFKNLYKKILN
jgi:hypothetical protein